MNYVRISSRVTRPMVLLTLLLVVALGCRGYSVTGGPAPLVRPALNTTVSDTFKPLAINVVAVYPLSAPVTGGIADPMLGQSLTVDFVKVLDSETSLEVMNLSVKAKVDAAAQKLNQKSVPLKQRAIAFGEELGAQGVIYGTVQTTKNPEISSRFERSEHARVGMQLTLIDVKNGSVLWQANYHRAQQPLTDNLFSLKDKSQKRGLRFYSENELMQHGFKEAAQALESKRSPSA